MKGRYHFRVKSKRVLFEFTIRRNITVIKGDSATGKTTLLHMLYEYLRVGRESGYQVSADGDYYVYLRREVGRDWREAMDSLTDTVIFIEENNNFVFTKEFAEFVKKSGNYFVLVNRSPLRMLPYSIHEVYEIVTEGKHADVKESYHRFKELYSNYPVTGNNKMQNILTEDSNSGFQFFSRLFRNRSVTSMGGNSNVISGIRKAHSKDVLVIVDGAAFGAMAEVCMEYAEAQHEQRISIWMPESFEYLILVSGLIQTEKLTQILENPSDYVESREYESWEQYFTQLLTSLTKGKISEYSKTALNEYYTQDKNRDRIVGKFPEPIRSRLL